MSNGEPVNIVVNLRPIDHMRIEKLRERTETLLTSENIWFVHTVLAQCFLPYTDQKETRDWTRRNGDFSIMLTAGTIEDPYNPTHARVVGLPFGAKPRLFQSYVCTQAIKQQSPVIPVERSMTALMKVLGFGITGGKKGTIASFKDQITRFAACHFTIVGPGPIEGARRHIKAPPIKTFDVWFPANNDQEALWPSEIVLTDEPRAQDIYLWLTQRLCRIRYNKPLLMRWQNLYEMFGGESPLKVFKQVFPTDLAAARCSYPEARLDEHKEGYLFYASQPPIPKTKVRVKK